MKRKQRFPDKEIWLWSRYDFCNHIEKLEITKYVDYIIDGRFIQELADSKLLFRGSSNQQIWNKRNEQWVNVTVEIDSSK